jgi:hypothetical protein
MVRGRGKRSRVRKKRKIVRKKKYIKTIILLCFNIWTNVVSQNSLLHDSLDPRGIRDSKTLLSFISAGNTRSTNAVLFVHSHRWSCLQLHQSH